MPYQIIIKRQVIKTLSKLNEPHYTAIKNAIYNLAEDPRPMGYVKLKNQDGYRIRVSNYRIIYDIHDNILLIEVIEVGHRRDIYG